MHIILAYYNFIDIDTNFDTNIHINIDTNISKGKKFSRIRHFKVLRMNKKILHFLNAVEKW